MVAQGEGYVVNTASEAGLAPGGLIGPYHATKYAVVGLSESLSLELAGTGVGVVPLPRARRDRRSSSRRATRRRRSGCRPPAQIPMAQIEQLMSSKALSPADVAGRVVDAIRADRF